MRPLCLRRAWIAALLCIAGMLFFPLSNIAYAQDPGVSKKIKVVVTLFPLYDFVREIGGERVDAILLLPPGVEPHMYEPRPSDFETINSANMFFYTSDAMEPWVARLLPSITNQNLMIMAAQNSIRSTQKEPADPHIWLDFHNDQSFIDEIRDDLVTLDEAGQAYYRERAERYRAQLADLDRRYEQGLKDCRSRTVYYSGHVAFRQLAQRYGLSFVSPYPGFSPDSEPTPQAVAGMITGMKDAGVKTIFFEELMDPKIARVIGEETGARLELLSAAHNVTAEELKNGVTFLSIMEADLEKLKKALECR